MKKGFASFHFFSRGFAGRSTEGVIHGRGIGGRVDD